MLFFTITTVFWTPIIYDKYYTYYSTPKEHRWYFRSLGSDEKINDRLLYPKKYQKLPCYKAMFGSEKYCFNRGRISSIYRNNTRFSIISNEYDKFPSLLFHFIFISNKVLDIAKTYSDLSLVRVNFANKNNEIFTKSIIKDYLKNNSYEEFIQRNNNKIVEIKRKLEYHKNTSFYIFIENKIPTAYIVEENLTSGYRNIKTFYQNDKNSIKIIFSLRIKKQHNKQNDMLKALGVAKEIYNFIKSSQVQ
jgi:hypothetical protein